MAEQAEGDHGALATQLETMMSNNSSMSPRCCIFRVPNVLGWYNPKAYKPKGFSIGPFHYNKRHLKATQSIKLKYLQGLISRFPNPQMKLKDLTEAINNIREEALECYAGPINMSMDQFVKVLVLDGCFLIEFFRKQVYAILRDADDPVFKMYYISSFLFHDLILLENQIPWPVLARLFNMTITGIDRFQLHILALNSVYWTSPKLDILSAEQVLGPLNCESMHLLGLIRRTMIFFSSVQNNGASNCCNWERMPSATSLHEAGIKFQMKPNGAASILDIKFNDKEGVLEIPHFVVDEGTEPLLQNLISLEQCLPDCDGTITVCALLLDNLIDTAQDIEILCKSDIFANFLGIKESAEIFNQLCKGTIIMPNFYYHNLSNDVNEYCKRRWPKYRTVLMRDYFKHPWALISVIVAAVLLILTFLQTLYAIIGLHVLPHSWK